MPTKKLNIKLLPLTIYMFHKNFNLIIQDIELVIEAYSVYLNTNRGIHHYGNKSLEEWLEIETEMYTRNELNKLNPEGI